MKITYTRWLTSAALAALLSLTATCRNVSTSSSGGSTDLFNRHALLNSYATQVMLPALDAFEADSAALATATATLAEAEAAGSATDADWDAARATWRDAMSSWEILEVLQMGPERFATAQAEAVGDRLLRVSGVQRLLDHMPLGMVTDAALGHTSSLRARGAVTRPARPRHSSPQCAG